MKIEYGEDNHTWKVLDEVYWFQKNRMVLKKKKKCELKTYTKYVFEINMVFLFIFIIDIVFMFCAKKGGNIIIFIGLMILILLWDFYVLSFIYCKTKNKGGVIELNEKGISDFSDGMCLFLSWERIDYVVVGKEALVIMTDKSFCFYLKASYSEEVIKEIKKYKKDLMVLTKKSN